MRAAAMSHDLVTKRVTAQFQMMGEHVDSIAINVSMDHKDTLQHGGPYDALRSRARTAILQAASHIVASEGAAADLPALAAARIAELDAVIDTLERQNGDLAREVIALTNHRDHLQSVIRTIHAETEPGEAA